MKAKIETCQNCGTERESGSACPMCNQGNLAKPERSWEEMGMLERDLRSRLYIPEELKKLALEALPVHVRRKEYKEAAACQANLTRAEREIQMWQGLINLWLVELEAIESLKKDLENVRRERKQYKECWMDALAKKESHAEH